MKPSFTLSPIQSLFTKLFDLFCRNFSSLFLANIKLIPLHQPVEHIYLPDSIMQHFRFIVHRKEIFRIMILKACSGRKGLYATMNRWHIDPLLYGDICNLHFRYYFFINCSVS